VNKTIVVGVVSDTHLPRFGRRLPQPLADGLKSAAVERIFHCGDHTTALAIALLEEIAPVDAVVGNNDGPELEA
jgi:predicted phosphodiesterase